MLFSHYQFPFQQKQEGIRCRKGISDLKKSWFYFQFPSVQCLFEALGWTQFELVEGLCVNVWIHDAACAIQCTALSCLGVQDRHIATYIVLLNSGVQIWIWFEIFCPCFNYVFIFKSCSRMSSGRFQNIYTKVPNFVWSKPDVSEISQICTSPSAVRMCIRKFHIFESVVVSGFCQYSIEPWLKPST